MNIPDADTLENNSGSMHYVITPLSCALPNRREGGPKGSGDERLKIMPGTLLYKIYRSEDASEQYHCNYGVNEEYERQFVAAGVRISAKGMHGETRAIELPDHRFFLATLFQPQLSSRPGQPHPVMIAFLEAAMRFRRGRSRPAPRKQKARSKAAGR